MSQFPHGRYHPSEPDGPQDPVRPQMYEPYPIPQSEPNRLPVAQPHPYQPYGPQALAPYGVDPLTGLPYSDKSKTVAGLLQIFLGGFGVGRFYLGKVGMAFAQLTLYLFSFVFLLLSFVVFPVAFPLFLFAVFWPLVDGIVLLAGHPRDRAGRPLRS